MKINILVLLFTTCTVSSAFASWNIECEGSDQANMNFTDTSFLGKPTLHFESPSLSFNSSDLSAKVEVSDAIHDGGMFVTGSQMNWAGGQKISFYIPELSLPNGSSDLRFDMQVTIETIDGRCSTLRLVQMQCTATKVCF